MSGVTRRPVIASWSSRVRYSACAVWERAIKVPLIGYTGAVRIGPIGWYVTIVVFEIIDSPSGKRGSVEILMADFCWVATTGFCASAPIQTKLQAERVNRICNTLDARRKLDGVVKELTGYVVATFLDFPTIIDCLPLSKR